MNLIPPFFNFQEISFTFLHALPGLFVIGPSAACVALFFMYTLIQMPKIAKNIKIKPHLFPFIPAIICGIIGMFLPQVLGLGVNTISNVITSPNLISFLMLILLLKLLLTSICVSFGLFGGVFSPSLFLGAVLGAIIFHISIFNFDNSILPVLAVAGMAAVSSSVIGAPITAIILVLELTGSYKYAIASILPICLSNLITLVFFGSSFFDRQLLSRGIDMSLGRENIAMSQVEIGNHTTQDYIKFHKKETTTNILRAFINSKMTEGYFVTNGQQFLGKIRLIDIIDKKEKYGFELRQKSFIKLNDKDNLISSIDILSEFVGENVPVINENHILIGVVSEGDVLTLYKEVAKDIKSIEKN